MLPILQRLSAKFKWRNLPLDQPPKATPTDAVQARQSRRRFDDLWIHPSVHWEFQSPHNNNQGRRFLKVNLRDSRRQAYAAIARLGSWLMEASPSLADVGENVRSERGPPSSSIAWKITLLPTAHVRIDNLLSCEVIEQIRWCCFLTVLATICPFDPCLLIIMMQAISASKRAKAHP